MAVIKSDALIEIIKNAPNNVLRFINMLEFAVSRSNYVMTDRPIYGRHLQLISGNADLENEEAILYLSKHLVIVPEWFSTAQQHKTYFINPELLRKSNEAKEILDEAKRNVLNNIIQNHLVAITKYERNTPPLKPLRLNPGERVNAKPVISIDNTGNVIKYKSIGTAARQSKTDMNKISDCINGRRKKAGGMYWKLYNEINCTLNLKYWDV